MANESEAPIDIYFDTAHAACFGPKRSKVKVRGSLTVDQYERSLHYSPVNLRREWFATSDSVNPRSVGRSVTQRLRLSAAHRDRSRRHLVYLDCMADLQRRTCMRTILRRRYTLYGCSKLTLFSSVMAVTDVTASHLNSSGSSNDEHGCIILPYYFVRR